MNQNFYQTEPEYEPVSATGWLIATYIFAILGGWLAIVLGFAVYNSTVKTPDGYKEHKYIESHRTLGLIGGILGIVSLICWRVAL